MPFERICKDCGDVKIVYARKDISERCSSCSKKTLAKQMSQNNIGRKKDKDSKKIYWSFCPTCPSVFTSPSKRKSHWCKTCANNYSRRITKKFTFNLITMQIEEVKTEKIRYGFKRTCVSCGDIKYVRERKRGGLKVCKSCTIEIGKAKKDNQVGGFDGRQKVQIGTIKKDLLPEKKDGVISIRDYTDEEKEMIEQFLRRNK